jgi:hypothetical protein
MKNLTGRLDIHTFLVLLAIQIHMLSILLIDVKRALNVQGLATLGLMSCRMERSTLYSIIVCHLMALGYLHCLLMLVLLILIIDWSI